MMCFPSKTPYMVLFTPCMVFVVCIFIDNTIKTISSQAKGIKEQIFQIQPLFHCNSMGQVVCIENKAMLYVKGNSCLELDLFR